MTKQKNDFHCFVSWLKRYYNSISRQTGIQTKVKKIDDFDEMIMESNKSIWIEFDWMKVWWRRSPFNSFISFLSSLPNGKREEMNWVDGHCGMDGNEVWFDWLVSFVVGYRRLAAIMLRKEKKATKPIKLNVLCFLFIYGWNWNEKTNGIQ